MDPTWSPSNYLFITESLGYSQVWLSSSGTGRIMYNGEEEDEEAEWMRLCSMYAICCGKKKKTP